MLHTVTVRAITAAPAVASPQAHASCHEKAPHMAGLDGSGNGGGLAVFATIIEMNIARANLLTGEADTR